MNIKNYKNFLYENKDFSTYDRKLGRKIMLKYLSSNPPKEKHSECVAKFAYKIAKKLKNNGVDINPEFVGFLGYVHDIGYSVNPTKHELHSMNLLIENEGIPYNIARYVIHGQMFEQYEQIEDYLPKDLEGKVLVYADMSVNQGEPTSLEHRAEEIYHRVKELHIDEKLKKDILDNLEVGMVRFKKYEKEILQLSNSNSYLDF